ncbi:MAG: hypothetical protein KME22_11410 [Hassallia sp. WJT32-NPBG1]|jgi:chromosome segregation ATPase|nr:hypothetical protein [Hassallia sp. WJT32-NPBG1]
MPKTTAASPAQILGEEIKRLEEAIAQKECELLEQQAENAEFSEALRLLSADVARYIPTGHVAMVDVINGVLDESSNQEDRQNRWNACQRAFGLGQQAASNLQAQLEELRERLAIALDELDWLTNYEPYAEKYRSGFMMPSPEQRKQERVEALQQYIKDRQLKLESARRWLSEPEGSRSYYPGDALREVQYLSESIPVLEGQLDRLIAEPVALDKKHEAAFRVYVRSRVAVQPVLDPFLEAQEQYLAALEQFKKAIASHPDASQFPSVALTSPRIVSGDGAIRLV